MDEGNVQRVDAPVTVSCVLAGLGLFQSRLSDLACLLIYIDLHDCLFFAVAAAAALIVILDITCQTICFFCQTFSSNPRNTNPSNQ